MSAWSDGYVSDINYTYGYYTELNPNRVVLPFLMAGLAAPKVAAACELGFGQGVSLNAHAAAGNAAWWGTDFNPAQAGFAQELAEQAGSSAHIVDQAFGEFCSRTDLPDFDFIGLHGIWSWVSNENRHILVDFVRRKLKVGGVLYISYNTLPGWAAAGPIRHLLAEHAHVMGATGQGMVQRVKDSVVFTQDLLALSHSYTRQVPAIPERIQEIGKQNPYYLAHEYFNRDWHPMYFSDMQNWLEDAKVSYACSANFLEDFATGLFDEEQQAFLAKITDPSFAQTAKDYLLNKQFRKDYWVKGARKISSVQVEQAWQQLRFLLVAPVDDVVLTIRSHREVSLRPEIFKPILNVLADHKPHDVTEIMAGLDATVNRNQLYEALSLLHGKGDVALVQDDAVIASATERCARLNRHLMQVSRVSSDVSYLVSPVSGGAITYNRINQLFLLAYTQGLRKPKEWVDFVWQILNAQGHLLMHEGKTLQTEKENRAELLRLAQIFVDKYLVIARALAVVAD